MQLLFRSFKKLIITYTNADFVKKMTLNADKKEERMESSSDSFEDLLEDSPEG